MVQYRETTSTTRGQRITLWVIAVLMIVGTFGSFAIIVFDNINTQNETAKVDQLTAEYQTAYTAYEAEVAAQSAELSEQYYETFSQYADRVGEFDADSVTELGIEDIVVGDGEELDSTSTFTAYYIGWTPDGEIFDQSIDGDALSNPLTVTPGSVIEGWSEGVIGMKIGGVRQLTIPSDMAYGESGTTGIDANTPIRFVMMVIPEPEAIEAPEYPEELLNYYTTGSF